MNRPALHRALVVRALRVAAAGVAQYSDVIRAILLEDSPCCGAGVAQYVLLADLYGLRALGQLTGLVSSAGLLGAGTTPHGMGCAPTRWP